MQNYENYYKKKKKTNPSFFCMLLIKVNCCFCQIMGNSSEFKRAVHLVIDSVTFEKNNTVQVFEATIR